jgi:hypothetical protein
MLRSMDVFVSVCFRQWMFLLVDVVISGCCRQWMLSSMITLWE